MKLILAFLFNVSLIPYTLADTNIEFTVMHGPGGVSDITTRHIANKLGPDYSVINRPGGAGRIAIKHLMSEKTIMLATMVQVYVTNTLNFNDLDYDPIQDFEILSIVGVMPSALVCNKKTNILSYNDFLKNEKRLTFGIGGYGSSEHLSTATFFLKTKSNHTLVSYPQGGNKSISDVIGGHIDCMFANFPTIKPHLQNENLVLLMTSHDLGYAVSTWEDHYNEPFPFQSYLAIIASNETPKDKLDRIKQNINLIVTPELQNNLKNLGLSPLLFTGRSKIDEVKNYMKVIKDFILTNKIKTTN